MGTFVKAILEFRLQGRQKRAELFDKYNSTLDTDNRIARINSLLENDSPLLRKIPITEKYYYLGYYEQIAIAVNSGLIKKDVAHYMCGYYILKCWECENFWDCTDQDDYSFININKESYYWNVFKKFAYTMQLLENRNISKNIFLKYYDKLTGRSNFKY